MSLIIDRSQPDVSRVVGVACDCCNVEVRDAIELRKVVHIRLHAGFGSAWGDGNHVEADLCDACGHKLLRPYASIVPTSDVLRGEPIGGLDPDRADSSLFRSPHVSIEDQEPKSAASTGVRGTWAWVRYQTLRYFIPAFVLLRPVMRAMRSFADSVDREELKLRVRFGRD